MTNTINTTDSVAGKLTDERILEIASDALGIGYDRLDSRFVKFARALLATAVPAIPIAEQINGKPPTHDDMLLLINHSMSGGTREQMALRRVLAGIDAVMRERDLALVGEAAANSAAYHLAAASAQPSPARMEDDMRERMSCALHYPACWDTAAYPTLESAVWEAIACAKLGCSACATLPAADSTPAASGPEEWISHWAGSAPYKGWSIRSGREEIIWLGESISSEDIEAIVAAHNKCFDCEGNRCVMNCSGLIAAAPVAAATAQAPDIAEFCELIDDYQCAQKDGSADDRAKARIALINAYRDATLTHASDSEAQELAPDHIADARKLVEQPDERASMTRMFHAACADLGAINEALGLDPDDGGAEPIIDAIEELKARAVVAPAAKPVAEVVAQDTRHCGHARAIEHLYPVKTEADLLPVGTKLYTVPPLHPTGKGGTDAEDAERYRWLREQQWNEADMAVVCHPKKSVKLGFDCPSGQRLDDAIDAALLAHAQEAQS